MSFVTQFPKIIHYHLGGLKKGTPIKKVQLHYPLYSIKKETRDHDRLVVLLTGLVVSFKLVSFLAKRSRKGKKYGSVGSMDCDWHLFIDVYPDHYG